MDCSVEEAAIGVVQVANEHMARALRVISLQRGVDPRGFTLVSFGGAGGLHVCALAETLGMERAMVPVHAGVLSALGMLASRPGRQLSRTALGLLADRTREEMEGALAELAREGRQELLAEGVPEGEIEAEYSLDLRYQGQSSTLNVPWDGIQGSIAGFEGEHERRYGHRMGVEVELVNLRVALRGPAAEFALASPETDTESTAGQMESLYGVQGQVPVFDRGRLAVGQRMEGPALVTETVATTWIAPGWSCSVDDCGNLSLEKKG
jgi:N-methylhydantoinase A